MLDKTRQYKAISDNTTQHKLMHAKTIQDKTGNTIYINTRQTIHTQAILQYKTRHGKTKQA